MQDAIAGFQTAPLWAQIAMALFAFMVAVSIVEPFVRDLKFRRQFNAIARALGQEPPSGRGWPVTMPISVDGRVFEVRHDRRSRSKGSSYRGPTGHLLVTATRLAGTKWPMHQVDVRRQDTVFSRLLRGMLRPTGDPEFDARFLVIEDGQAVRDGWLDEATRAQFEEFFDQTPVQGDIWTRDGELLFTMPEPWKGVDGQVMRSLLERQAALASTLEQRAGERSS